MSKFLENLGSALADQMSSQFSTGENNTHSLDAVIDGQNVKYGSLGDFAQKFDQSAERRYVEEGYLRRDPYNADPKQLEILMQEPNATVLVKKKMFSSVAENFRPDFMDKDEILYYKAIRVLFANKCRQIAALEKLSKIEKISSAVGKIDVQLMPIIFSLTDSLNFGLGEGTNLFGALGDSSPFTKSVSNLTRIIDRVRKVYTFNQPNKYTTWITDTSNLYQSQFGQGTGVIEITNFTNLTTSVSVDMNNPGTVGFSILDPYEVMLINDYDIERAISDATNMFYNKRIFQFGLTSADEIINNTQMQLNQARGIRKASPISIKIDPDTLLGKRVTAIIDSLGIELVFKYDSTGGTGFPGLGGFTDSGVEIGEEYLKGGAVAGFDGLDVKPTKLGPDQNIRRLKTETELSLFKRLITAIYNKLQLLANSQNSAQIYNGNTNYVRRKMRFNFSGKLIIQPMDTVHVYMNSKSRFDNKILAGLNNMMTGSGILQNINNTLTDFTNAAKSFGTLFGGKGGVPLQVEKSVFVGPDFPNHLWTLMRTQFVTEQEGTHVFGGVIESATDNWAGGKFTIDVRGRDNTYYFEQGKINFKPGADVFAGFFDPLTPFKTKFDEISSNQKSDTPDLLEENKYLMGPDGNKSLVRFKLGPYVGEKATQGNYIGDHSIDPITGAITKVFYAPDGLVYKWKEGIGVFTQTGSSNFINDPNRVGNQNTFSEPFAGQDIMNVLSLLIAGVPYNFATYYKTTNQGTPSEFTRRLNQDLTKSNTLWGNFIPFKNIVLDEESYKLAIREQSVVTQANLDLESKLREFEDLNNKARVNSALNALGGSTSAGDIPKNSDFYNINSRISALKENIDKQITKLKEQNERFNKNFGVDASADFNQLLDANQTGKQESNPELRRHLRMKMNFLTRRMSYEVRANEDRNLFIVDDFYDKDYDIAAFSKFPEGALKMYNNEFTSVKEKIQNVAGLLNLEVFCDTQGHIRVRPPQYNRIPSSVFYRMMYLKQALNVQVFPQYLDDLFSTQMETLRDRLEVIEDQIRLYCAILGKRSATNVDDDTVKFIRSASASENKAASFAFVSGGDGLIADVSGMFNQANPDAKDAQKSYGITPLKNFNIGVGQQANTTKDLFPNTYRYSIIKTALESQKLSQDGFNLSDVAAVEDSTVVNDLINRIRQKSSIKIEVYDFVTKSNPDAPFATRGQIDIFKLTQNISDKIRERQAVLKLFYNTIKNVVEYRSLDDPKSKTANRLLVPANFGKSQIPEVFEHMIEDEGTDDYGPGSGSRYIIKRSQIRSINISENPPPYTAIQVQGVVNLFLPNESLPEGLNSFPGGGNGMVTAMAVDYDLWRSYGYKEGSVIRVPFLNDPKAQTGPYASMLLSRNRKNILRGTVTISGNEYMQPGEVVFLQDRGMLFYVNSVRHNLTFGSDFSTTLELTYGHTPGEYIPTFTDMIGKLLFKNKDVAAVTIHRQASSNGDKNIGVVLRDGKSENKKVFNTGAENEFPNSFSANNIQTIKDTLYYAAELINRNEAKGNKTTAYVELRYYYDDSNPINIDVKNLANATVYSLTKIEDGPKSDFTKKRNITLPVLNPKYVKVEAVNLSDPNEMRSPSQKAWSAARNQMSSVSVGSDPKSPSANTDRLRKSLFSYIVDVYATIKYTPDSG